MLQPTWVLGHAPVPLGSACWGGTSQGKPQPRGRVVPRHVGAPSSAKHDFTGRLWTLPWESPAMPCAILELCQ